MHENVKYKKHIESGGKRNGKDYKKTNSKHERTFSAGTYRSMLQFLHFVGS